eukprot:PhM_4_TR11641/c2_g2_i1/m.68196
MFKPRCCLCLHEFSDRTMLNEHYARCTKQRAAMTHPTSATSAAASATATKRSSVNSNSNVSPSAASAPPAATASSSSYVSPSSSSSSNNININKIPIRSSAHQQLMRVVASSSVAHGRAQSILGASVGSSGSNGSSTSATHLHRYGGGAPSVSSATAHSELLERRRLERKSVQGAAAAAAALNSSTMSSKSSNDASTGGNGVARNAARKGTESSSVTVEPAQVLRAVGPRAKPGTCATRSGSTTSESSKVWRDQTLQCLDELQAANKSQLAARESRSKSVPPPPRRPITADDKAEQRLTRTTNAVETFLEEYDKPVKKRSSRAASNTQQPTEAVSRAVQFVPPVNLDAVYQSKAQQEQQQQQQMTSLVEEKDKAAPATPEPPERSRARENVSSESQKIVQSHVLAVSPTPSTKSQATNSSASPVPPRKASATPTPAPASAPTPTPYKMSRTQSHTTSLPSAKSASVVPSHVVVRSGTYTRSESPGNALHHPQPTTGGSQFAHSPSMTGGSTTPRTPRGAGCYARTPRGTKSPTSSPSSALPRGAPSSGILRKQHITHSTTAPIPSKVSTLKSGVMPGVSSASSVAVVHVAPTASVASKDGGRSVSAPAVPPIGSASGVSTARPPSRSATPTKTIVHTATVKRPATTSLPSTSSSPPSKSINAVTTNMTNVVVNRTSVVNSSFGSSSSVAENVPAQHNASSPPQDPLTSSTTSLQSSGVTMARFCTSCGKEHLPDAKFCAYCGARRECLK